MTPKTSPQASLQNDIPAQLEFSTHGIGPAGDIERSLGCPGRGHNGSWGSVPEERPLDPIFRLRSVLRDEAQCRQPLQ